jgi:hypothetical protein
VVLLSKFGLHNVCAQPMAEILDRRASIGMSFDGHELSKRDFLRTVTPALLTDGLRIEGGI